MTRNATIIVMVPAVLLAQKALDSHGFPLAAIISKRAPGFTIEDEAHRAVDLVPLLGLAFRDENGGISSLLQTSTRLNRRLGLFELISF